MSTELIQAIRAQSKLSISQAISFIENQNEIGKDLLSKIFKFTGKAFRIGITGPPGSGKSSLTDQLISVFREKNKKVAVIAIDPTSPFSGGAVLGDRIRMTRHHSDQNVFIRSIATRGSHGGLSVHAEEIGDIFDAAQFDIIIYETVGVGQIELDIVQAADTVVVVLVPESGDGVQMMKAGLMEIGNIFAINKADRPGSNKLNITLQNILSIMPIDNDAWRVPVIRTIATEGKGIEDLVDNINSHNEHAHSNGLENEKINDRYKRRLNACINLDFQDKFWDKSKKATLIAELKKSQEKRLSPYLLSKKLLENE